MKQIEELIERSKPPKPQIAVIGVSTKPPKKFKLPKTEVPEVAQEGESPKRRRKIMRAKNTEGGIMSDRELFQYKLKHLGISEVVNDFNLEHSMKEMLLKKKLYKFKKEDFTDSELRDKELFKEELTKFRGKIEETDGLVRRFDLPDPSHVTTTQAANCFLINKICEEGSSFAEYKKRKIKFERAGSMPRSSVAASTVAGALYTHRSTLPTNRGSITSEAPGEPVEPPPPLTVSEKMT